MLTSIRLENFKCFELLELQPRRITVLIGPNGAGKSSVLQALMFLRQSLEQNDPQWQGKFVNLVGFPQAFYSGAKTDELAIAFQGERTLDDMRISFSYRAEFSDEGLLTNIGEIDWGSLRLPTEWRKGKWQSPSQVDFDGMNVTFHIEHSPAIGNPYQSVGLATGGPTEEQEDAYRLKRKLINTIPDALKSWRFGPPVRGFLKSSYALTSEKLKELLPAGPYDHLSQELASTLGYDKKGRLKTGALIERVTGVPIEYGLDEGPEATVNAISQITHGEIPIVSEGFGTNQLTFLMYQLVKTPKGGLAGIEEPETHLHPKAIARLGDVFVEIATQERKQLLLATHSDHLLLSLLNNVAERKLAADDLAIYYFQLEEGKVAVHRQEVTDDGLVKGGLPGFFDAALEAQRRHLDAVTRHQPQEAVAQRP